MLIYGLMMKMNNDVLSNFIEKDNQWLSYIIEKYPDQIPVVPIAKHWGCNPESLRAIIRQDQTFGMYWKRPNATRNDYLIPTGVFIRWYCKVNF